MERHRATPHGFMTVGELAKKMGTTVRTLQYYDKEGLLSPSAESEGGRRLYTDKDMVKLHQILSLKYLGFSLDDIKTHLISLDTPFDVADVLTEQAGIIQEKIASLTEALHAIRALRAEILQMQTVDFKKYADIIVLLQNKNDLYWVLKKLDDTLVDHIWNNLGEEQSNEIADTWKRLCNKTVELQRNGTPPESEEGRAIGKAWWDMIMSFTGGDMSLLPKLIEFNANKDGWDNEWKEKQTLIDKYLGEALIPYFMKQGINPFEGYDNDK